MVGGAAAMFDPATDTTAFVNAGTYYLYITGQNGYSGKIQKEYVIAQKDISDAAVEVTLQDNIDWDKVLADAAADPDNACHTYLLHPRGKGYGACRCGCRRRREESG